jgi:hypothetical protein
LGNFAIRLLSLIKLRSSVLRLHRLSNFFRLKIPNVTDVFPMSIANSMFALLVSCSLRLASWVLRNRPSSFGTLIISNYDCFVDRHLISGLLAMTTLDRLLRRLTCNLGTPRNDDCCFLSHCEAAKQPRQSVLTFHKSVCFQKDAQRMTQDA